MKGKPLFFFFFLNLTMALLMCACTLACVCFIFFPSAQIQIQSSACNMHVDFKDPDGRVHLLSSNIGQIDIENL